VQNKVGTIVPTAEEVTQLLADVQSLSERMANYTVTLTAQERGAAVKMRTGGENIVSEVATLAKNHSVSLPQITLEAMNADLTLAQRLRPLASALDQLSQRVSDTVLEAQSECWWSTTAYYTALCRIAGADPTLENALKPVVGFFAVGRRKKTAPAAPAV
jgi:hypothetical protein